MIMTLSELKLNDSLAENITGLIVNDRLPHAILIDGGSQTQRSDFALYLACAFICEAKEKPCGHCRHCLKAQSGVHPDIVVSDPERLNEKTFKIGAVREIRNDSFVLPNEAEKKVYIMKSADKMNPQAQNALLKILEEPPSYARFILECESRISMLATIMSRVTPFNLGADDYSVTDDFAEKADELAAKLACSLLKPVELDFMKLTAAFERDKNLFQPVLSAIQLIFRDAVVLKSGSTMTLSNHKDISKELSEKLSMMSLMSLVEKIDHFNLCLSQNANKNLLISRFCSVIRSTAYNI